MSLAFQIAKRVALNHGKSFSRFIIRLSVTATALSVMVMIVTLAFVNGFQQTVSEKVFSFWGHIRVQHYEIGKSMIAEESALTPDTSVEKQLQNTPGVIRVQRFATKSAVLEASNEIEGVLLKGIDQDYDSTRLQPHLTAGRWIHFDTGLYSREIILSESMARQLRVGVNDTIIMYFVSAGSNDRSARKISIAGLYKTGMEEYDKLFVLGDIRLIRRINDWNDNQIGGYEVLLQDRNQIDTVNQLLSASLPAEWMSRSIREIYPNIFDWLNIQDVNRNVIFTVMTIVAIINLITCLLILILERTRMIGLLKAMGARDAMIRNIFLYYATLITLAGVGLGTFCGVGLCLLQVKTGFIRLDEASYYVSVAPVQMIWWQVAAVCAGTTLICYLALMLPSFLVKRIQPVKAIQFR